MSEKQIPNIQTTPVKSSNIAAIGHDPSTKTMAVQFKGSGIYHFRDVPAELFDKMLNSESVGKFFHSNIRGKFDSEKHVGGAEQ